MREAGVGVVVVVDDERPTGIVSEHDVAIHGVAGGGSPALTSVAEIATSDPLTVSSALPLSEAQALMAEHDVHQLLVVEGGHLVGLVSASDLDGRVSLATDPPAPRST